MLSDIEKLNRRFKYYKPLIHNCLVEAELSGDVIDVGCGSGLISSYITEYPNVNSITGIDICNESITQAKSIDNKKATFLQCDCYKMPYKNNSFDCCFALNLLEVLQRPIEALVEIKRVLKNQGIVCLIDIDYRNISISHQIKHLNKLNKINNMIKISQGYDPFVGSKLANYCKQSNISIVKSIELKLDKSISPGFNDTLLYNDNDINFLLENNLFTVKQLKDMFDDYNETKKLEDFLYEIIYNVVIGQVGK